VLGAEATELGEVARAVRLGVLHRDWFVERRLIRIFAQEDLVGDVFGEGRFGTNPPRRCDHDDRERGDRSTYDDPYDERQHAFGL
jgi:hypothetical protein